ncbi:hypothetical protein MKW98_014888 [Papaver atlanticum]|uniref:DNA replication complex GINS protein SLD5 n=1 Tax=Papaver atlanticum TaxID=357466 RepID=A0AAD4SIA9_9MAGN|nr:hypothetical protein MKW98_014888 [Papaver atlanticum]
MIEKFLFHALIGQNANMNYEPVLLSKDIPPMHLKLLLLFILDKLKLYLRSQQNFWYPFTFHLKLMHESFLRIFEGRCSKKCQSSIQNMEDTVEAYAGNGQDALTVSLYQMDLDRTEFLLRSYLRTRLQKIEKYMIHISKSELWNRLSKPEQEFAKRCKENMENHLKQSVLSRLPFGYQDFVKQSISSEEDDMVPEPQLDTFVFCKSKGSVGSFQLDAVGDEVVDLIADDLYVLRYKSIKPLVETGQIDLV